MDKRQLVEFHRTYAKRMGIRFIEKRHWGVLARLMRYLLEKYLSKFASKIPNLSEKFRPHVLKNCVVLSYDIGDLNAPWTYQVETAAHEGDHVLSIRDYIKKGGKVSGWYRDYFFDDEFRARKEGSANATSGEIYYAVDGDPPEVPNLDLYYVGSWAQSLSDRLYKKRIDRAKELGRGSSTSPASSKAIAILREMGIKVK